MKDQEAYLEFFADKGESFEDLCQKMMLEDDGTHVEQENIIKKKMMKLINPKIYDRKN